VEDFCRDAEMDYANVWGIVLAGGEGTRVRSFLQQTCGGSGLKQFSAIIDDRSMLRCTLDRVTRLIPRERVVIVVSAQHRNHAARELADWPSENVIYQPRNRDTAAGILLPVAHITNRDPAATVVVFPSDHFVDNEPLFMNAVADALQEIKKNPSRLVLLGMTPQAGEETEYGYILGVRTHLGESSPVAGFIEKPPLNVAKNLIQRGALWNTMVFAVENTVLWDMVQRSSPALYHAFRLIQMTLRQSCTPRFIEHLYEVIPAVNFSSAICEPLASRLSVLAVPDVGWSDWGTVGSILRTLKKLGKTDAFYARSERSPRQPVWHSARRPARRAAMPRIGVTAGS
jgi:mannose-1-phosphate guanylyltransferase